MTDKLTTEIVIVSDCRYEDVIAECYIENKHVFCMSKDKGNTNLEIEIFSVPNIDLKAFLNTIEKAKKRLLE